MIHLQTLFNKNKGIGMASGVVNDPAKVFRRQISVAFLIFGGVITVSALGIFLLSRSITSEARRLAQLRGENKQLIATINAVAQLNTDNARVQVMTPILKEIIPDALSVATEYVPMLRSLGATRAIQLIVRYGAPTASSGGTVTIPVSGSGDGALANLTALVRDIEAKRTAVAIRTLDITPIGSGRYRLTFDAVVHARSEQ